MPGLSKLRRPGTERGHGSSSTRGRCARSVKTPQTWNGERPRKQLYEGQACQVCQNSADLERGPATEAALRGAGAPGLQKTRRPGTETGTVKGSCKETAVNIPWEIRMSGQSDNDRLHRRYNADRNRSGTASLRHVYCPGSSETALLQPPSVLQAFYLQLAFPEYQPLLAGLQGYDRHPGSGPIPEHLYNHRHKNPPVRQEKQKRQTYLSVPTCLHI